MGKLKRQILNILFWVFLIIGIIMVVWRIFGDSPSDLAVVVPFIVMGLIRIGEINDEVKNIKYDVKILSMNTKSAFEKVRKDFGDLSSKIKSRRKK